MIQLADVELIDARSITYQVGQGGSFVFFFSIICLQYMDVALEAQFLHDAHKTCDEFPNEKCDHIFCYPVVVLARLGVRQLLICYIGARKYGMCVLL